MEVLCKQKLISYLSCEKFEQNIFEIIKERYKSNIIKDAVIINIKEINKLFCLNMVFYLLEC